MPPYLAPNRAICDGDRARAGLGERRDESSAIQRVIADWSTPFLKKFFTTARSEAWRKEVHNLLVVREGATSNLQNLNSKRARRKRRGSKQAQSFGRALRSP